MKLQKLNSGVADICKEKIDVIQLLKQSLGQYSEKFAEKKLEVISVCRFLKNIYMSMQTAEKSGAYSRICTTTYINMQCLAQEYI